MKISTDLVSGDHQMLPVHTSIELTPSPLPPPQKESSFHSSLLAKIPPRQPAGLFAPSEAGDTTDANSSDTDNGLDADEDGIPYSVESSADSTGNIIFQIKQCCNAGSAFIIMKARLFFFLSANGTVASSAFTTLSQKKL